MTELGLGVGRFGLDLGLEADSFCIKCVFRVLSKRVSLRNLALQLQEPYISLLSLMILSGLALFRTRISFLSAMQMVQERVLADFMHLIPIIHTIQKPMGVSNPSFHLASRNTT